MSETNVAEETKITEILDDNETSHSMIAQDALKNYRFLNNFYKEELSRTTDEKKIEKIKESIKLTKEEYVKLQEKFKTKDIFVADISDTEEIDTAKSDSNTDQVEQTEGDKKTEQVEQDKESEISADSSDDELDTMKMMTMQLRIEEERTKQEEEKTKQEEEKTRQEEYKTKQLELRLAHGTNLTNDILSGMYKSNTE
jgi:hypothetical protein